MSNDKANADGAVDAFRFTLRAIVQPQVIAYLVAAGGSLMSSVFSGVGLYRLVTSLNRRKHWERRGLRKN